MHTSTYVSLQYVFINICGRPFIFYFLLLPLLCFLAWALLPQPAVAAACIERRERGGDFSCTTNVEPYEPQDCMSVGETKNREVRAISQCQSTHGAAPIRSTTVNERQEKIVEGASERERKRMNDVCPSLLRLITCPSFVCVYFSFPHLSLLVLFCISSVTNGRPPSFPRPFTRLAVYLYFLCIFFYFSSIFFFTVHFLTGMGSFHSWRIRLQTIVIPFMGYCKKERKRRIRKKIGKIKRDTEMRKNRKEKRR